MTRAALVFPHQLFAESPLLAAGLQVWLVEEALFFHQYRFHKQKLQFHRASMQYYRDYARNAGRVVHYVDAGDPCADIRHLLPQLQTSGVTELHYCEPADDWLHARLKTAAANSAIALVCHPSAAFLSSDAELNAFFGKSSRRYLQHHFYVEQRSRRGLLLDRHNAPLGGAWSLDKDNRKRYPAGAHPPLLSLPDISAYHTEALHYVQQHFPNNPGSDAGALCYPVTHTQAEDWLVDFLEQRFAGFGPFEDAIVAGHEVLHHSVLTPALNAGLLTPQQILTAVLAFASERKVPLNSVEGFVRQLLGWREFIHGMYRCHGRTQRNGNHWDYQLPIPRAFYTATTGVLPVDMTIRKVLQNAYCHHIERLMVLGNFMLLCEIHPDEVHRWFMELFIDAYDWVMVPNVYGMSQFADGGMMATKPYISGSNYLRKMSDYPQGEWCDIWDGLFWRFVLKNGTRVTGNPRMAMLRKTAEAMDVKKRDMLLERAEAYLVDLHQAA